MALVVRAPWLYCFPVESVSSPQADAADGDVAGTVRLMHRRHGWNRAAITGAIAWALAEGASVNAAQQGTPVPSWFSDIVLGLGALTVVCIIAAVVYSNRLRRRPAAVRAQAAPVAARHPHGPRAHHYPPRHRLTWYIRWLGMLIIVGVAVISVPAPVDGIAYLAGTDKTVTFDPVSYETNCDQYSCQTSTEGFMEVGSSYLSASWPDVVPLNRSFPVREPKWRWGLGEAMIDSDGTAVIAIAISLLIEGAAVLAVIRVVQLTRNILRHRRSQRQAADEPARVA